MIDFHLIFLESTLGSPTWRHRESRPMQAQWQNDPTLLSTIVNDETADKATKLPRTQCKVGADWRSIVDWPSVKVAAAPTMRRRTAGQKSRKPICTLWHWKPPLTFWANLTHLFPLSITTCVHNSGFPVTGTQCLLMTPHFLMFAFLLFDPPLENPPPWQLGSPLQSVVVATDT